MKFRWTNSTSKTVVVVMALARIRCKGMDIDEAIRQTLGNGHHCKNPDLISEETLRRLRRDVEDRLKVLNTGNTRRVGKRSAG
ncbi:hypothetical protein J19TS2_31290 [Cohnella xylanilytica]|uniref:hypothetical protein n=1 Tax=Cohnella xylanilytica TaxID=557555 RepID=UPI001B2A401E|nr:hypothetical protein [Cohnella xylanilytica]GIO13574.1 hypothetical protein J19TS2_31290 [Cohnella xylanilytica]